MTNTITTTHATDLQLGEQLQRHLASMYQSMYFVVNEMHSTETPEDIREHILNIGERFLFAVANAADELSRMSGNAQEVSRRAFINIRRAIFAMHAIVVDARERYPDSWVSTVLHAHGMDILNAFHEVGPMLARLGGWHYQGFRTENPWKPMATDPRLETCIV